MSANVASPLLHRPHILSDAGTDGPALWDHESDVGGTIGGSVDDPIPAPGGILIVGDGFLGDTIGSSMPRFPALPGYRSWAWVELTPRDTGFAYLGLDFFRDDNSFHNLGTYETTTVRAGVRTLLYTSDVCPADCTGMGTDIWAGVDADGHFVLHSVGVAWSRGAIPTSGRFRERRAIPGRT